jgi:hypothetical protein
MSAETGNAGNEVGWMRCDRFVLMILLAVGLAAAFSVRPDYMGVQDTGSGSSMDVGIMIDCDTNSLAVTAKSNGTGEPIPDASAYLFYTNYEYRMISSGKTNDNGLAAIAVTGKRDYLTSLFILRVDKQGFRSREIEFTYKKCFDAPQQGDGGTPGQVNQNQTAPPEPNITKNVSVNQTLPTNQTGNVTANATVPKPLPQNASVWDTANQTTGTGKPPAPCMPGFLLIPFVLYQAIRGPK